MSLGATSTIATAESSATGNIADAINQMPALFGSQTPRNSGSGISTSAGITRTSA